MKSSDRKCDFKKGQNLLSILSSLLLFPLPPLQKQILFLHFTTLVTLGVTISCGHGLNFCLFTRQLAVLLLKSCHFCTTYLMPLLPRTGEKKPHCHENTGVPSWLWPLKNRVHTKVKAHLWGYVFEWKEEKKPYTKILPLPLHLYILCIFSYFSASILWHLFLPSLSFLLLSPGGNPSPIYMS